jgi:hypothetical protein
MRAVFNRLNAALPDAITAGLYLTAWIAPSMLGAAQIRLMLAAIVTEFMVMHASALYGFGIRAREDRLAKRSLILGAITAIYLVPIVLIALNLRSIGPVLSFAWLFTCRFAFIWMHPTTADVETRRMKNLWGVSLAAYVIGIMLVNKLPLPALGFTPDVVASLSMSGHPDPHAQPPWLSIAFGVFYFFVQACAKYVLSDVGTATAPSDQRGRTTA